jgi:DNA-binding HxlR family transcriptional regulator
MQADDPSEGAFCPVHDAIEILQEKWTLHVIRALLTGPLGFNELSRAVGGCNPATLAARLAHLEAAGIVLKTVVSHMPPRTSYSLSCSGHRLQEVIEAIDRWSRENLLAAPVRSVRAG